MKTHHENTGSLRRLICRIDMTGLAAVLFVLVTAFAVHPVADLPTDVVDLSQSRHANDMHGAIREDAMLVVVTRDGGLWFDHGRVDERELYKAIREGLDRGSERKVYIRADKRARYGAVRLALNSVQAAGVQQVGFLVDQRTSSGD